MTKTESSQATATRFRPLGNRVLVKRMKADERAQGGILLPESAQKKQEQAEVIAVGEGKRNEAGTLTPPPVSAGDIVIMDKYSGQEVTIDGEDYLIVRGDDLIAKVQK